MRKLNGIITATAASLLALTGGVVANAEPVAEPAAESNNPGFVATHDGEGYVPAEAPVATAEDVEAYDPVAQDADILDPDLQVTLQQKLAETTITHLTQQGHTYDEAAQAIATEWAQQGATGQIEFQAGVAQGINHLEEGTGNIYRLTPLEAQQRVDWLQSSEANYFEGGQNFGVGAASDGTYFYVAEYFLN